MLSMQTSNPRLTNIHHTIRFLSEETAMPHDGLEKYIKQNHICDIEGARVFSAEGVITIVDLKSIQDERILRFIQTLKHSENLINVVFLSEEEWESLNNFIKTLEGVDV